MPPMRKGKASSSSGMPKKTFVIKKMSSPSAARSPTNTPRRSKIWLFRSKYSKDNSELGQIKDEYTGNHFVACLPSARLKNVP